MKNTNKEQLLSTVKIVPQGAQSMANGEAAKAGVASQAVNVREREQSLQVVGTPSPSGSIGAGHTLVLVDNGQHFYLDDNVLLVDGTPLLTLEGNWVGIRAVGTWIVVVTTAGVSTLLRQGDTFTPMNANDALPEITLAEDSVTSVSHAVAACTFEQPYTQWQAPLAEPDERAFTALLRAAWTDLLDDAADAGAFVAPVMVRWAVRLWDDSYLWMSAPQRLGDCTLNNTDRITATVNSQGASFTGTNATTWAIKHYKIGVQVANGVPLSWQPWVKAIDIFATAQANLLTSSRTLEYRCLTRTVGTRIYELEMGLRQRSATAITHDLLSSAWTMVATAGDVAHLTAQSFVEPDHVVTLTGAQCDEVMQNAGMAQPVCLTAAGGRLYACDATGTVTQSLPGNPWVAARRSTLVGVDALALAAVTRPLYSSGFGRYPVYVFTTDGIFAMPQSAKGTMGDARLVDRTVIAAGTQPVEGDGDVFFTSRQGHLCRLNASRVKVALPGVYATHMAWNASQNELWTIDDDGAVTVLMPSGRTYTSTLPLAQLYSDPRCAVAVDRGGQVLDLEQEQAATLPVTWLSQPVLLATPKPRVPYGIVWDTPGNDLSLTLTVRALRGVFNTDYVISRHRILGQQVLPTALPLTAQPLHSVRLEVEVTASTGTLLMPAKLVVTEP